MALGTPVTRGVASRAFNSNDLVIPSFTPNADELLIISVVIDAASGAPTPDAFTGQDAGITWDQIGSTQQVSNRFAQSLWIGSPGSSPSAGTITIEESTTAVASATCVGITGADVSGTALNSLEQFDQDTAYGSSITLALTSATNVTIHFWAATDTALVGDDTELDEVIYSYNQRIQTTGYNASGNTAPSASTVSATVDFGGFAIEVKEAGAAVTADITGTATATIDEDDITAGGKTVIVTLTGDTFKAAGTGPIGSTADTQALIDGFDAASSPTNGWNNEVRDKALTSEVVRTSSTVATWTIAAQAGYDISAQETITATIPTDVLVTGSGAVTGTPTFTIDQVAALPIGGLLLLGAGG
jgi:hypothetical protein